MDEFPAAAVERCARHSEQRLPRYRVVPKSGALRAFGLRIAGRHSMRVATVAVSRRRADIMLRMWLVGTKFCWKRDIGSGVEAPGSA